MEKKQTQPAGLPYKGAPLTAEDIIMRQVQLEDRGIEGFVRTEPQYDPENMQREVTVNRKARPLIRNWGLGNVKNLFAL